MKLEKNFYPKNNTTYINKSVKIKEYFKIIGNYIFNKTSKSLKLLDAGCGSGDFLWYMSKNKNIDGYGVDFSNKFISLAKKKIPKFTFKVKDIRKKISQNKFDICTCLGTLSAFDDPFKIVTSLINITKRGGEIILFDLINENNVNVIVRYQNYFDNDNKWLTAFNTFSKQKWIDEIKKNKSVKKIEFKKFQISINIKKNKKNPMKTWTTSINNSKQIVVGTGQMLNYYIVKIKL